MKNKKIVLFIILIFTLIIILLFVKLNNLKNIRNNNVESNINNVFDNTSLLLGTWNYYNNKEIDYGTYYTFKKNNIGSYNYKGDILKFNYKINNDKLIINYEDKSLLPVALNISVSDKTLKIRDDVGTITTFKKNESE